MSKIEDVVQRNEVHKANTVEQCATTYDLSFSAKLLSTAIESIRNSNDPTSQSK